MVATSCIHGVAMAQTVSIRVSRAARDELNRRAEVDQRTLWVVLDRLLGIGVAKTAEADVPRGSKEEPPKRVETLAEIQRRAERR